MLEKLKTAYKLWYEYYQILPKLHRHTLGQRIDTLFIESIEAISVASFLSKEEKLPWIRLAIRKLDTQKVLLMILWETKSIDDKRYINLSIPLDDIGKNLGGWSGQIQKQNSPITRTGEK